MENIEAFKKGEFIDNVEAIILDQEPVECIVDDIFTPGLYTRQLFIPAGTILTTKLHKTEHPYVLSMGKVVIYTDDNSFQRIEAPFTGITYPGTRRIIHALTDAVWTTFHVNPDDCRDVATIEDRIIEPHTNQVLNTKLKEELK